MFDTKLAAHLAALSKLKFTENELEIITEEMDSIVTLMDTVTDFESIDSTNTQKPVGLDSLRPDTPKDSDSREDILKNAKQKSDTCFTVPKVV